MPTVIGLYRSSFELEKSVEQLLSEQFQASQLRVVPMHLTEDAPKARGIRGWLMHGGLFGDTLDRSDGTSVIDGAAAGATLLGLTGVIVGATFRFGPIALGAAGLVIGCILGILVDAAIPENRRQEYSKALLKSSTLLHVKCSTSEEARRAELILRENQAHEIGQAS